MMFAARKLQGIGLIVLLTLAVLVAYPVWLNVSATRTELQQVRAEIARVQLQNRMLEGDIAVLANVRQLDRWNGEFLGYVAPSAQHYLAGERALASLDRIRVPQDLAPSAPVLVAAAVATRPATSADENDQSAAVPAANRATVEVADRRSVTTSVVDDIRRPIALAANAGAPVR